MATDRFRAEDEAGNPILLERPCPTARVNVKLTGALLTLMLALITVALAGLRFQWEADARVSGIERKVERRVTCDVFNRTMADLAKEFDGVRRSAAASELRALEDLSLLAREQERLAGEQRTTNEILTRIERQMERMK